MTIFCALHERIAFGGVVQSVSNRMCGFARLHGTRLRLRGCIGHCKSAFARQLGMLGWYLFYIHRIVESASKSTKWPLVGGGLRSA